MDDSLTRRCGSYVRGILAGLAIVTVIKDGVLAGIALKPVAENLRPFDGRILSAASWSSKAVVGLDSKSLLLVGFDEVSSTVFHTLSLSHFPIQTAMSGNLAATTDGTNRISLISNPFTEHPLLTEFSWPQSVVAIGFLRRPSGAEDLMAVTSAGEVHQFNPNSPPDDAQWIPVYRPSGPWATLREGLQVKEEIQFTGTRLVVARSRRIETSGGSGRTFEALQLQLDSVGNVSLSMTDPITNRAAVDQGHFRLVGVVTNYLYFTDGGLRAVRLDAVTPMPVSGRLTGAPGLGSTPIIGVNGTLIYLSYGTVLNAPSPSSITVLTNEPSLQFERNGGPLVGLPVHSINPDGALLWNQPDQTFPDVAQLVRFVKWKPKRPGPEFISRLGGPMVSVIGFNGKDLLIGDTRGTDPRPDDWTLMRFQLDRTGNATFRGNQQFPPVSDAVLYPAPADWTHCYFVGDAGNGVIELAADGNLRWLGWSPFGKLKRSADHLILDTSSVSLFRRVGSEGACDEYVIEDNGVTLGTKFRRRWAPAEVPKEVNWSEMELRRSEGYYLADGMQALFDSREYRYAQPVFIRRLADSHDEFFIDPVGACAKSGRRLLGGHLFTPVAESLGLRYAVCGGDFRGLVGIEIQRIVETDFRATQLEAFGNQLGLDLPSERIRGVYSRPGNLGLVMEASVFGGSDFVPRSATLDICGRTMDLGTPAYTAPSMNLSGTSVSALFPAVGLGLVEAALSGERGLLIYRMSDALTRGTQLTGLNGLEAGDSALGMSVETGTSRVQLYGLRGGFSTGFRLVVQRIDLSDPPFPVFGPIQDLGSIRGSAHTGNTTVLADGMVTWVSTRDRLLRLEWANPEMTSGPTEVLDRSFSSSPTPALTALFGENWLYAQGSSTLGFRKHGGVLEPSFVDDSSPDSSSWLTVRLRACGPFLAAFDSYGGVRFLEDRQAGLQFSEVVRDRQYVDAVWEQGQLFLFARDGTAHVIEPRDQWVGFPGCNGLVLETDRVELNLVGTPGLQVTLQRSLDLVKWTEAGTALLGVDGRAFATVPGRREMEFFRAVLIQ